MEGYAARTFTLPPVATAKAPFCDHSSSAAPPLVVHVRNAPFQFLQSQIFTVPSRPEVAMYRPPVLGSMLNPATGPTWASNRTAGWGRFGVQRVTVPFWCPRCITALCAFCVMVVHAPSLVRCSATICPVDVSWYLRKPGLPYHARNRYEDVISQPEKRARTTLTSSQW